MAAPRWSNNNPQQGSAFHELVVLPTLAPQLARPYHVPGTPAYHEAQAQLQAGIPLPGPPPVANGFDIAGPAVESQEPDVDPEQTHADIIESRLFFVNVTIEWIEPKERGSRAKKTETESKLVKDIPVLKLSRVEFIPAALGAHQYQDRYSAGPHNGPGMLFHWQS